MKKFHIYSKMANGVNFHDFRKGGAELPSIVRTVVINGGAGVATKHLLTPLGIHTEVTAEEMEFLKSDGHFKKFVEDGFIIVGNSFESVDKMVTNMTSEPDPSAPLTPADYLAEGAEVEDNIKLPEDSKKGRR